jgi:hypothetical protein
MIPYKDNPKLKEKMLEQFVEDHAALMKIVLTGGHVCARRKLQ